MKAKTRMALEEGLLTTALFTGAVYFHFFTSVRSVADRLQDSAFKEYLTGPVVLWEMFFSGLGLGVLFALVNYLADTPALRGKPFGYIILLKSGLYLASLLLVGALAHFFLLTFFMSAEEMGALMEAIDPGYSHAMGAAAVFSILAINFLLEVRRKVGPGNLTALLTGRYQRPRIEERLFLFMDLEASTTIAEQLGHVRYSELLRDCFHDLTEIVLAADAQVYQYVGDEVILTWRGSDPQAARKCLQAFFAFEEKLAHRQAWYRERYGVAPVFRGGADQGAVTATEVGDLKREIAYHGDPLNTAARLLERCKQYRESLLVSGRVWAVAADLPGFAAASHGEIALRGKQERITVYGILPGPPLTAAAAGSTPRRSLAGRRGGGSPLPGTGDRPGEALS